VFSEPLKAGYNPLIEGALKPIQDSDDMLSQWMRSGHPWIDEEVERLKSKTLLLDDGEGSQGRTTVAKYLQEFPRDSAIIAKALGKAMGTSGFDDPEADWRAKLQLSDYASDEEEEAESLDGGTIDRDIERTIQGADKEVADEAVADEEEHRLSRAAEKETPKTRCLLLTTNQRPKVQRPIKALHARSSTARSNTAKDRLRVRVRAAPILSPTLSKSTVLPA